jgi:hypothetical protein
VLGYQLRSHAAPHQISWIIRRKVTTHPKSQSGLFRSATNEKYIQTFACVSRPREYSEFFERPEKAL